MSEPNPLLLWCDVESTGLPVDDRPMTVLEVAWSITDGEGRQLTPLRQAFTKLVVMMPHHKITTRDGLDPVTPRALNGVPTKPFWASGAYPLPEVRHMHEGSGLAAEWLLTDHDQPWRIVSQGAHLDGLLLDDLSHAGDLGNSKVHLAGAGVSHMEALFLPKLCPRTAALLHYATIDVSVELRSRHYRSGGRAPGSMSEQLALAMAALEPDNSWAQVTLDIGGRYDADDERSSLWVSGTYERTHRAAVDVARALAAYRSLTLLDEHAVERAEERGADVARPI